MDLKLRNSFSATLPTISQKHSAKSETSLTMESAGLALMTTLPRIWQKR